MLVITYYINRYDFFGLTNFLILSLIITIALLVISYLLKKDNPDYQKLSPYECGFEPFSSALVNFNIHFFIVAILFLIFDLEVILLVPWALSANFLGLQGLLNLYCFLFILVIGLVYEWVKKALEW